MEELTNPEKTVVAHLAVHHRIQPGEPAVVKIFGGDQAERRKVLTSLRDRGFIQHYRRPADDIEFICPSAKGEVLGRALLKQAKGGVWAPDNIELGKD
jgi:hypothetical protein